MIRPLPSKQISTLPSARKQPDPQHVEDLSRLADEITEMAAHLAAGTCQLLELIHIFDEEGGWHGPGIASCAHWLNWKCSMSMGTARERVRVARALPALPKILACFRQGKVSYSKVRAMTRVATWRNEDVLLNVALHGTAEHVEIQVRQYRKVKRIEAFEQGELQHARRRLDLYQDDDGSWVIHGRLSPEQGALIARALDAAKEQLFEENKQVPEEVPAEIEQNLPIDKVLPHAFESRRADALERMAEGFLAGAQGESSGGDRYLINVHTDIETLKEDGTGAESEIEERGHVSAETSRRMACDCSVVHWHDSKEGEPLSVGRKTRSIPPAIRRALKRRDGGCRFPGCGCTRFVDAHHIRHWVDGGETSMDNLVLLCRRHHRLVHEEGFGLKRGADGAINFSLPDGKVIPPGPDTRFSGNVVALRVRNREKDLNITPDTLIPKWCGEKMDHQMAVLGLLQRE
jgi:5-methylcytosine-specific restriction endonuclease McrA